MLDLFLRSIDPLDAGGQFCDRGREYTTAIFVDGPAQRRIAEEAIAAAEAELGREIVTPILPVLALPSGRRLPSGTTTKSNDRLAVSSVGLAVPKRIAYQRYRDRCGRDARVRQIWGDAAPFASK